MIRCSLPAALLGTLLPMAAVAQTSPSHPVYGPRLEGFEYPHPVALRAVRSQGQDLEMAYIDIAPAGEANGRTVVLLHGKNFCGATWERTVAVLTEAGHRVLAPDQIGETGPRLKWPAPLASPANPSDCAGPRSM